MLDAFPWAAWLASGIVHGGLLLALSLAIIASPQRHLVELTSDSGGAPLEAMNLDEASFDDIAVPGVAGEASLGPIVTGDGVELPGPVTGAVGNVRHGTDQCGRPHCDEQRRGATHLRRPANLPLAKSADRSTCSPIRSARAAAGWRAASSKTGWRPALAGGGTRQSEDAVERGLAWLAEHQFPDGGWRFDLSQHPRCAGQCRDSGDYDSTTAATGLALLSFLGAGYTQRKASMPTR